MLARPQAPFVPFARFSIGCGTGIASLLYTIRLFGTVGGLLASACIGIVLALTVTAAVPWFFSCFEKSHFARDMRRLLRH